MLRRAPGVLLISVAAAMWGTDALFRRPPAQSTAAATILFTQAFVHGDPITPVVLQKVQPLVAIVAARLLLGEEPRRRFGWFLVPALAGIWLIAFPHPTAVHARGLEPIALALGAAFGRFLSRRIAFEHVATLRFAFGLAASAAALPLLGAPAWAGVHDSIWIVWLALVTGALALGLYYYGLRRTPATLAALGEPTYPVTAGIVGYAAFGASLRWSQWLGVAVTVAVVALLPMRRGEIVRVPA